MASNFFTNEEQNSLYKKFVGVFDNMPANLLPLLENGTYTNLTNEVYKLRNETIVSRLENELIKLSTKYTSKIKREIKKEPEPLQPKIIISETFV